MICNGTFQTDSHALLVAERGVEYHKLSYQGKIDYWQEVKIEIIAPWCDHDDDTDTDDDEVNIDIHGEGDTNFLLVRGDVVLRLK